MTKTVLFVDGDILTHRAVLGNYHDIEWEPGLWTYHVDFYAAQESFKAQVERVARPLKDAEIVVSITGPGNFRYDLCDTYKGHRKPKPPGYRPFQDWIREASGFQTYLKDNIEADDTLGILMTNPNLFPGKVKVLWSADKDLKQIPGIHLVESSLEDVTELQAEKFHAYQTLVGDVTDNYPGCPGIGAVKAEKLLKGPRETWWPAVEDAFTKAEKTRDDFLLQARLAKILRWTDYDYEKKQPILWEPPERT